MCVTFVLNNMEGLFEKAQWELLNISEWMRIHKLSINPQKTEYMVTGHPRKTYVTSSCEALTLNGSEIKHVKHTRSLGIAIDEGLKWSE